MTIDPAAIEAAKKFVEMPDDWSPVRLVARALLDAEASVNEARAHWNRARKETNQWAERAEKAEARAVEAEAAAKDFENLLYGADVRAAKAEAALQAAEKRIEGLVAGFAEGQLSLLRGAEAELAALRQAVRDFETEILSNTHTDPWADSQGVAAILRSKVGPHMGDTKVDPRILAGLKASSGLKGGAVTWSGDRPDDPKVD